MTMMIRQAICSIGGIKGWQSRQGKNCNFRQTLQISDKILTKQQTEKI